MVGKNNTNLKLKRGAQRSQKFSLKKLSIGVVSVATGTSLLIGSLTDVYANDTLSDSTEIEDYNSNEPPTYNTQAKEENINEDSSDLLQITSNADISAPRVIDVVVDRTSYEAGETVTGHIVVEEDNEIEYAYISFEREGLAGTELESGKVLYQNSTRNETGQYILPFEMKIAETMGKSTYTLSSVQIKDAAKNVTWPGLESPLNHDVTFEVINVNGGDITAPRVIDVVVDRTSYEAGETVTGHIVVEEDNEIEYAYISFERKGLAGTELESGKVLYQNAARNETGQYILPFEMEIAETMGESTYTLSSVQIKDAAKNETWPGLEGPLNHDVTFEVINVNGGDITAPRVIDVVVDRTSYEAGETVTGHIVVEEDNEIEYAFISFERKGLAGTELESGKVLYQNAARNEAGQYILPFEMEIAETMGDSTYTLSSVQIKDAAKNETWPGLEGPLNHDVTFEIVNSIDTPVEIEEGEHTPIEFIDIKTNKNDFLPGETLTLDIIVKSDDNRSPYYLDIKYWSEDYQTIGESTYNFEYLGENLYKTTIEFEIPYVKSQDINLNYVRVREKDDDHVYYYGDSDFNLNYRITNPQYEEREEPTIYDVYFEDNIIDSSGTTNLIVISNFDESMSYLDTFLNNPDLNVRQQFATYSEHEKLEDGKTKSILKINGSDLSSGEFKVEYLRSKDIFGYYHYFYDSLSTLLLTVTNSHEEIMEKELPFKIEYINNPDLIVGTEEVSQAGVNGIRTIIEEVTTIEGEEVKRVIVSDEVTTAPVNQVVQVGIRAVKEETRTEDVTFETEFVNNPELLVGEEKVTQEGVNGDRTIVEEVTTIEGIETDRVVISDEITTTPVNEIIQVGTREVTEETRTEDVAFKTEYVNNAELLVGEEKVTQEGVDGVRTITEEVIVIEGEETERIIILDEITTAPVHQVVQVGTKEITEETRTEEVVYETEYINNSDILEGTEEISREGVNGVRTIVEKVITVEGVETAREVLSNEITTAPVNQVVQVGTRDITEETSIEDVAYEVEYVKNSELLVGTEEVSQAGVNGVRTIVEEVTTVEDVETDRVVISDEITTAPVNEIVQVGTKEVTEETRIEDVAFETDYVNNPDLIVGMEEVSQAGVDGVRTIMEEVTLVEGEEVGREIISNEITTAPVNQVVQVGAKEVTEETRTEDVAFETEYVNNIDLLVGTEEVTQEGVNGVRTIVEEVTLVEGEEVDRIIISDEITTAPVNQVVQVGTKETTEETRTEDVAYQTEYVNNPELLVGTEEVTQDGVVGVRTIIEEVTTIEGVETAREVISNEITTAPVNEIIQVGTREVIEETRTEDVAFETEYVNNSDLLVGTKEVSQEGVKGVRTIVEEVSIVDGEEVEREVTLNEITTAPVNQVIQVGTKEVSEKTRTVEVPYETEYVYNPNLLVGEEEVSQEGLVGVRTIVEEVTTVEDVETDRVIISDEVTTEPVKRVVQVGTRAVVEETSSEDIAFETEYVHNPNLLVGKEEVSQEGIVGVRSIVEKVTLVEGEEVDRVIISDEVTTATVKRVVQVGTREVTKETRTEDVAFETEYVNNADLLAGTEEVTQEGVDGIRTVVEEVIVIEGEETERVVISDEITTAPVNQIVQKGTKAITLETYTEEINFETEYVSNSDLLVGEEEVIQAGKNGVRKIVEEVTTVEGEETDRVVISDEITAATVNQVIRVGTRTVKEETRTEDVAFETEYVNNPDLIVGTEEVSQAGKNGVRMIVEKVTTVEGEEVERVVISDEVTTAPVNQVIQIGKGTESNEDLASTVLVDTKTGISAKVSETDTDLNLTTKQIMDSESENISEIFSDNSDAQSALGKLGKEFAVFDIHLLDEQGLEVAPTGRVTVLIPYDSDRKPEKLYYFGDNFEVIKEIDFIDNGNSIEFVRSNFSYFGIQFAEIELPEDQKVTEKETKEETIIPEDTESTETTRKIEAPEDTQEPDVSKESQEGEALPKTATLIPFIGVLGASLISLGSVISFFKKNNKK